MQLIESYNPEFVVTLEGRSYPIECLLEDDDGFRIGLFQDLREIPALLWVKIHSAGARHLVSPEGDGWIAILTDTHLEFQEQRTTTYRVSEGWYYFDHFPHFREVKEAQDAPKPRDGGFVHLHTHSEFSPLDGLSMVSEIVGQAAADNQPAVAVTDHGVCAAHPHLQKEAEKQDIKPIFGIEANFTDDRFLRGDKQKGNAKEILADYRHLILLAQNNEGLRNIWAMNTEGHREGFYGRPRIDWDTLERHAEGVIASTGCLRGPLAQKFLKDDEEGARAVLGRLLSIFGERLYVELHTTQLPEQEKVNNALIALARDYSLPTIAVVDSHYPTYADRGTHRTWLAIQTNKDVQDEDYLFAGETDYHMMTEAEVRKSLDYLDRGDVDDAIANTVAIAAKCDASLGGKSQPPVFSKGDNAVRRDVDRLIELCISNWQKTLDKSHSQDVYEARFEREMRLLISRDYCGYFLMVSDYCRYAREHGILVGPGRGSGSGSLVAYLSEITGIDPVEADLMFERFLTEGRVALPDFDVDFPTSKRQDLTDYITDKYGEQNVVRVGTHIKLKNKGVVRDLQRTLKSTIDIHYPDIDKISQIIDAAEADKAGLGMSWEDLMDDSEEELAPFIQKYPLLFDYAEKMVGRLKTYGKHAAGVVIAPDTELTERLPMRKAGGELVAEFDMDALESLGLVKFDLLTLRTLDTIQVTSDLIQEQLGHKINVDDWSEEYEDPMVWDELCDGHTLGVFQIETPGGTRDTKRFQPKNLNELADVITLVRPGPKRSGLTEIYLRRKEGEEAVSVLDERLEPILRPTYGCMIYQEQVINTFMVLAGYDSGEADDIRRILGKKKIDLIEEAGVEFRRRAIENGTDPQVAQVIWEQIQEFARYGFNRSHAYGYAMLGFWTAWFKFHYPVQFLTACLSTVDKGRIPEFINEARRMGFRVLPPDINISGEGFTAGNLEIRYGFDGVKGIGSAAVEAVTQGQPYESFDDFMERKGPKCNIGTVKILASVGAFDSLVENRRALEMKLEWESDGSSEWCQFKDESVIKFHGLPCHFDWEAEPAPISERTGKPLKQKPIPKRCTKACRNFTPPVEPEFRSTKDYTEDEIMEREMELLGVHLSATPFDNIPDELWTEPISSVEGQPDVYLKRGTEVEDAPNGEYVTVGLVLKSRPHMAKNGKQMGFAGFYCVDAELDITIFSEEWARYNRDLRIGNLCFIQIRKNDRGLTLEQLQPV